MRVDKIRCDGCNAEADPEWVDPENSEHYSIPYGWFYVKLHTQGTGIELTCEIHDIKCLPAAIKRAKLRLEDEKRR